MKLHMSKNQLNDWGHAYSGGGSYNNKINNTYTERWKVNHSQFHNSSHDTRWKLSAANYVFFHSPAFSLTFSPISYSSPYQSQALLLWVLLGVLISCIADAVLCNERSSAKWCSMYRRKIINRYSRNLDNMMSSLSLMWAP